MNELLNQFIFGTFVVVRSWSVFSVASVGCLLLFAESRPIRTDFSQAGLVLFGNTLELSARRHVQTMASHNGNVQQ